MNRSSTRRTCLQLLLGGIAASCWSPIGGIELATPSELERLRKILVALLWETPAARAIAESSVRAVPDEQVSPLGLMRAILGPTSLPVVACMTAPAIRRVIVERIQGDFLRNHIASIDGWILSMTEARLYALARADRRLGRREPAGSCPSRRGS
jgi:hypothetical protein